MRKGLEALAVIGLLSVQGCGGGGGGATEVKLQGAIQKGPFVVGSGVQVSMLDRADASPTGAVFNTTTRNDLGEFEVKVTGEGLVEVGTTGFYFNEITGELSKSQITLRAIAELGKASTQSVFVNALTQMSHQRIRKLVASGKSFTEARQQAEVEVRAAIGLPQSASLRQGTEMNLLGGDDESNAYLFALSCVLGQAAVNEAPSTVDARLQELVGAIALDLESDGTLSEGLSKTLALARSTLDPLGCARNMRKRLEATGSSATLPDVLKAVDFDGDGIADASDTDADGDGVAAADDRVRLVSGQGYQGYAVDSGGQLWAWELGSAPKVVTKFAAKPIAALVTTGQQSMALLENGTLVRWGVSGVPTDDGRASGVVNLSGRPECTSSGDILAVKEDGTVWNLAENGTGVSQVAGLADVAMVAGDPVGGGGVAVVKKDGTVWVSKTGPTLSLQEAKGLTGVKALVGEGWYCKGFIALGSDGAAWRFEGADFTPVKIADGVLAASSDLRLVKSDGTVWKASGTSSTLTQDTALTNVAALGSRARVVLSRDGAVLVHEDRNDEQSAYVPLYLPR